MFKQAFLLFSDSHLTSMGLLIFMLTFLGAFVWTFLVQRDEHYEKLRRIPFEEGENQ